MSLKTHIKILKELELTKTESDLLEVNLKLMSSKLLFIKKVAISGISSLISQVNFRYALQKGLTKPELLQAYVKAAIKNIEEENIKTGKSKRGRDESKSLMK